MYSTKGNLMKNQKSGVSALEEFLSEFTRLVNTAPLSIKDPPNISEVSKDLSDSSVQFEPPISIRYLISSSLHIFAILRDAKLAKVEFLNPTHVPPIRVILKTPKTKITMPMVTYTEALALFLRPNLLEAVRRGRVKFSNDFVEAFILQGVQSALVATKKGFHRYVDLHKLLRTINDSWYYVTTIEKIDDICMAGLSRNRGTYYFVFLDNEMKELESVSIGTYQENGFDMSMGTTSKLPLTKYLMEKFETVKNQVKKHLELLKVAYIGVKAYVT